MQYIITSGNEEDLFEISDERPASLHFKRKIKKPRTYDLEILGYKTKSSLSRNSNRPLYYSSRNHPFTLRLRLIVTNWYSTNVLYNWWWLILWTLITPTQPTASAMYITNSWPSFFWCYYVSSSLLRYSFWVSLFFCNMYSKKGLHLSSPGSVFNLIEGQCNACAKL